MIARLTGKPERLAADSIILDVHGVGYKVFIIPELKLNPENFSLYIHTHIREDTLDLYGFVSVEELNLFKLIISVSGIGPRTGMMVLARGVAAVSQAVARADLDFFTSIPRLGKKNAQKIIIELKSKMDDINNLDLSGETSETKDAVAALVNLGFKPREAREAVRRAEGDDAKTKIKSALKNLGKPQ